jgi:hypothetical protein
MARSLRQFYAIEIEMAEVDVSKFAIREIDVDERLVVAEKSQNRAPGSKRDVLEASGKTNPCKAGVPELDAL